MPYEDSYKEWLEKMLIEMSPDWLCDGMHDNEFTYDWCEKYCGKEDLYITPKCLHIYYHHIARAEQTENCSEKPNNCETCRNWDTVNGHCYFIQECRYEPKTEPQIFTWGKEVHEYCKRNCDESKARMRDGDRFIVCGQANDEICISLGKCPLGKWVTGEGFHILPMDEPQTERSE
jgi:hypothetical protein